MNKIETRSTSDVLYFPIFLEGKLLQFLQLFPFRESNIESILNSFSNKNYKIRDSCRNSWVLRIPNDVSRRLCHQRQEIATLKWAFQEGFSLLEVRGYDEQEGYLLTPFLFGESCSAMDFENPSNLQGALEILHRLHTSKTAPIEVLFDPLERYAVTSEKASQEGIFLLPKIHQIADKLKDFLLKIPKDRFQLLPCHNDPSPENFFLQNGRLYLHDWELARRNDPMWDLAHLSVIARIEPEKLLLFYPTSDPLAKEKIFFFQAFVFFNTIIWTSLEREHPTSSLPKEKVEILYQTFLKKIDGLIKSVSFQTALKKLLTEESL